MSLHQRLKDSTLTQHRQIEQTSYIQKIIKKTADLNDYVNLLIKYYSFIHPCELLIESEPVIFDGYNKRSKSQLLTRDLLSLGLSPRQIHDIPLCTKLPPMQTGGHVLGYLYVMEGSTLGGQILLPIIQTIIRSHAPDAHQYFNAYGKYTAKRWIDFCDLLNTYSNNHIIASDACDAAILTFTYFHQWLSESLIIKDEINAE